MANNITVVGNLGGDADIRYLQDGTAVCSGSVADEANRKNAAGEWERTGTTWWRFSLFGSKAEAAANVLVKGARVIVTGRAALREYTSKDGEERRSLEIKANDVAVVPRAERDGNRSGRPNSSPATDEAPF